MKVVIKNKSNPEWQSATKVVNDLEQDAKRNIQKTILEIELKDIHCIDYYA